MSLSKNVFHSWAMLSVELMTLPRTLEAFATL